MMQIIKILIWSLWLFGCNCLVAFLFVVVGSLIFQYHIHFYAGLIGGAILTFCELAYIIFALNHNLDDGDDWHD